MHGCYAVPNFSVLPFAGLQGVVTPLKEIIRKNDMGHPLFDNLRAGPWLMDYVIDRLYRYENLMIFWEKMNYIQCTNNQQITSISYLPAHPDLKEISQWIQRIFGFIRQLPHFLIPRYFTLTIMTVYNAVTQVCLNPPRLPNLWNS